MEVKIELEFGSQFQHKVYLNVLRIFLAALKNNMSGTHRKNKMKYNITENNSNEPEQKSDIEKCTDEEWEYMEWS